MTAATPDPAPRALELDAEQSPIGSPSPILYKSQIWLQVATNLLTPGEDPSKLVGSYFDAMAMLPILQAERNGFALMLVYVAQMLLAFWLGEPALALEHAEAAVPFMMAGLGSEYVALHHSYRFLALLAIYSTLNSAAQATADQKTGDDQVILAGWSGSAPMNYQHRWLLIEAERYRVQQNWGKAIEFYDEAIAAAKSQKTQDLEQVLVALRKSNRGVVK